MKEVDPKRLGNRQERTAARLARIARADCWMGESRALTIVNRLEKMGATFPYRDVVTQAYTSSTGNALDYLPFECPECGTVHLGANKAAQCCKG